MVMNLQHTNDVIFTDNNNIERVGSMKTLITSTILTIASNSSNIKSLDDTTTLLILKSPKYE